MPYYDYHPASTAKLGFPIDPRRPYDDKSTGGYIQWNNLSIDNSPIGASVTFRITETNTRRQLYEMMSLDLNVEAKFNLFSAKSSLQFEQESSFDDKTLVYVVTGKKIYNPQSVLGNLDFSSKGKTSWEKVDSLQKVQRFQRTVGTEVVTKIHKGNVVSLIYSFNCSSSSFKQKIKAKLDVGWSTGSVSVDFKKELLSIDESMNIVIEGFQSGVTGNQVDPRLTDIIKVNPGDIISIKKLISDILGNVSESDRDSSPIIAYNTTMISDIDDIANSPYSDDFDTILQLNPYIDRSCLTLNEFNMQCNQSMRKMRQLQQMWNNVDFIAGSDILIADKIKELDSQSIEILNNHRRCINATNLTETQINIPKVDALAYNSVLIQPTIIPMSWQSATSAWRTSNEHGTFQTRMWPVIHMKFPPAIKYIYIVLNSNRLSILNRNDVNKILQDNGSMQNVWCLIQTSYNQYVWGWMDNLVEAERARFNGLHKSVYTTEDYCLEIVMDDGSSTVVSLNNPNKRIIVSIDHFQNMDAKAKKLIRKNHYWEIG
jgi:hypothetical protein